MKRMRTNPSTVYIALSVSLLASIIFLALTYIFGDLASFGSMCVTAVMSIYYMAQI